MSIKLDALVYETTDPLRHVGKVEQLKGKKAWVRWHLGYGSWVVLDNLSTDIPEGKGQGDKLGPVTA